MRRPANRNLPAIVLVAFSIITLAASPLYGDDKRPKDAARDAIVKRLAHQEEVIKSCECLLTHRTDVTDPKMIPLIEADCRKTLAPSIRFIVTKDVAALNSYVAHWWHHGVKERYDQYGTFEEMARPGATPTRVSAFDGAVVRSYNVHPRPNPVNGAMIEGSILPASRWHNSMYPSTFLDEYGSSRYSDLLARSPDVKVTETAGRTTVAFARPKFKDRRFVLVFDRDGSLVQRDIIRRGRDAAPRIYERHSFSAYRAYRNGAGETVSFPSQADYDYALGTTDDGQLVVYQHVHIEVNSFQFNHQIPDETFVIQFPDGCSIVDRVPGATGPAPQK